MIDYSELNAKSCFSFLTGASHPEEIVQRAKELHYRAIGLVDQNGFYGMVKAYDAAKNLSIPLIIGTEIKIENAALSLIAKDFTGYKQLCRLLSEGFLLGKNPVFTREHLKKWLNSHIQVLIPPREFPTLQLLRFLQDLSPPVQLITKTLHPDRDEPLKHWLSELPKEIEIAWSWDPYFHEPSRHEIFEILKSIRTNTPLSKLLSSPNGETYLKPLSFFEKYKVDKKWIQKTVEISEACSFSPKEIRYRYPQEWLPKGKTSYQYLNELCEKGIVVRYGGSTPAGIRKQLDHELALVQKLEFEDYFLTVWDIVQYARSKDILCQGRGSAANSIICYLLEVTSIDPVQMNLLFERFISEERHEAPDIDVDFEHERREEVIQYIFNKYGRHRAGMVATLITYRTKSALRDVGKALEVPLKTIEEFSKRSSWRENVFKDIPPDPLLKRWLKNASLLRDFPRHLGQHTGGMILTQDRLDEISPIQPATMENRTVVQWDKYDIEKLGLLKIDLLSLGMLTCLQKSFKLIESHYGKKLELHTIPPDDSKTYDMIEKSQTVGVFQIESRAQMTMLPRLKPRCFYDLVIEVSIIRPGPIQGGMVHPYLKRRQGLEAVTYAHPKLKPILEKTLGVPIFQEQVMKMAIEVAGYTPGEADALRRAMGAWKKRGNLEEHSKKICTRLIQNGIPESFAEKVCAQILGFGEYGFPESHAASFALLSYASAYLKAHYPEVFLCSLLNSMPMGFYPLHMLTATFQRENVHILPVHTEFSIWDHQLEKMEGHETHALRLGFRCVRSMQKKNVEAFIQRRQEGEIDLFIFNREERASLAMVCESDKKREEYWKALALSRDSLKFENKENKNFPHLHEMDSMLLDFKFMETTLKHHPVTLMKKYQWNFNIPLHQITLSDGFQTKRPNGRAFVFGMVQIIQSPPTANGMFFITLEDERGFLNLVFTPPIYQKFKSLIQKEWTLLVSGRIQNQSGYVSIAVDQVYKPNVRSNLYSIEVENQNEENILGPTRLFY
ncbi:MAG: error-prone polymerase, DnaE-like protein [Bacteriovoracaceae bacterium]|nr:error-prone polymerase, DnaE-like protein [Bacteriovoracaceae bacterium]